MFCVFDFFFCSAEEMDTIVRFRIRFFWSHVRGGAERRGTTMGHEIMWKIVCDSQGRLLSSPRVRSPNGEGNDGEVVFLVFLGSELGCGGSWFV